MLTDFNKMVLIIATVVLVIVLVFLGVLITKSLNDQSYPPIISDCPDYWDVAYDANENIVCSNSTKVNRGRNNCDGYNIDLFTQRGTNIEDIMCEKYKWAKKCNVIWDGITNNNKVCDKTTL